MLSYITKNMAISLSSTNITDRQKSNKNKAFYFIILLGLVSLFADITYEGARSIIGPYLAMLGASAAVVGFVAGFGEFIGYGIRILSGFISDKTQRYWLITILGYTINLLAIPLLALAGHWQLAALLIMTERLGKAIRTPARDTLLSHAAHSFGKGFGFGLHEAMDQIGAMTGPIIVAVVLAWKHSYPFAFIALGVPVILALTILITARYIYPNPSKLESEPKIDKTTKITATFWIYLGAVSLIAAGFADYPLVAFHIKKVKIVSDNWIPILYSMAMGVDALSALIFGYLFDKKGLLAMILAVLLTAWFAPLVFSLKLNYIVIGIILWGIGLGVQESIIRAFVSNIIDKDRRATGYGIFNAGFGTAWFIGSALMGILYTKSLSMLIYFSVSIQLASIPIIYFVYRRIK